MPKETGWVEFKHNNDDPKMIGEDLSALANSATLKDRDFAYMIWGVNDSTHNIVGTSVRLALQKKGQEELGRGWDRMVIACEMQFLPAPRIEIFEESTKVTLFSEMEYKNIPADDKLWSCYLHSCLMFVQGDALTNTSLRDRFGLKESSAGSVSRLIKEAVETHRIKPIDPNTAKRYMRYVPVWASV